MAGALTAPSESPQQRLQQWSCIAQPSHAMRYVVACSYLEKLQNSASHACTGTSDSIPDSCGPNSQNNSLIALLPLPTLQLSFLFQNVHFRGFARYLCCQILRKAGSRLEKLCLVITTAVNMSAPPAYEDLSDVWDSMPNILPAPSRHRLIVGVDYGTTYSGEHLVRPAP